MNALANIHLVQSIFKDVQNQGVENKTIPELITFLNSFPPPFISVAFEAASFVIAQKSIQNKNNLNDWSVFIKATKGLHDSQVHVGLGWALASLHADIDLYTSTIRPLMRSRVIDGYGYYYALFRRRVAIRLAQIPSEITNEQEASFNQGIGRSLWYLAEANLSKLERYLDLIPKTRHSDVWRGIGIAYTYVGGSNLSIENKIVSLTNEYHIDFLCGIALTLYSREKSGLLLDNSITIGKNLLNDSGEAIRFISNYNDKNTYPELLRSLKTVL